MPYPMHLNVRTFSPQNFSTEYNFGTVDLANQRYLNRMYRLSGASIVSSSNSSSGLSIKRFPARARGFGVRKVFTGIRKMLTPRSKQGSLGCGNVSSLKRSSRVGYVVRSEYRGMDTRGRNQLAKLRGGRKTRSSKRSRRVDSALTDVVRMASRHLEGRKSGVPDVVVSAPNDELGLYRVHSFEKGDDQAAMRGKGGVKSSHPVVDDVRVPTPVSACSNPNIANILDASASIHSSASAAAEDYLMSGGLGEASPIRPKMIRRDSMDGEHETYSAFKARLNGHRPRRTLRPTNPDPVEDNMDIESFETMLESNYLPAGDVPPSLQFIPRSATIDLGPRFAPQPASPSIASENIQRHRDEAFRMLESGGVMAVLPSEDLPDSAVPVLAHDIPAALKPQAHPQSLLPGPRYKDHENVERVRPATFQAEQPRPAFTPWGPDDYEVFNPRAHYLWPPTAPSSATAKKEQQVRQSWLKAIHPTVERSTQRTPNAFATNAQHASHYSEVEFTTPPPPRRSMLSRTRADYNLYGNSEESASTPAVPRKAVPRPPSPPLPFSDRVPTYHKMNSNGYPIANLSEAARYSTTPRYCPRTVDSVEAKLRKGTKEFKAAEKKRKAEAKAAAKAAKGIEKERKKKEKTKLSLPLLRRQKQMDEGVRRFLLV